MTDAFNAEVIRPLPFVVTWPAEDVAELKNRVWSDQTIPIIAQRMNRSENSVRNKCYELRLKLPKPFWTDARERRLEQLVIEKLSASQIGVVLGITRNAVIGKVHRMGLQLSSGLTNGHGPAVKKTRSLGRPRRKPRHKPTLVCLPMPDEEPEPPIDQSEFKVSFADLAAHHCRFPLGDPGTPDFGFCGATKHEDHPYCARHCRIAYTAPKPSLRRLWLQQQRRFQ